MKSNAARKMKQVPEGYLIVGIDVHKKKHAAVVMTQDFTTYGKFKFSNSKEGFEMALERARMGMVKTGCRGVIFAIETGGHYWRNRRVVSLTSSPGPSMTPTIVWSAFTMP